MQRIIIDTDPGVDDALAILYALASPDVSIEAITAVHGNVGVDAAVRNVGEVLRISGSTQTIPVARGAGRPLRVAGVHATDAHGEDGLGGWTQALEPPPFEVSGEPAHVLISRIARQFPGEVALVTLGPLTNAALAFEHDRDGFRALRRIVSMGGAIAAPGNMTPVAEFNIYADPEAARTVVNAGVPMVLVGLDVTTTVTLTRQDLDGSLGASTSTRARFLRCISEHMFGFYRNRTGGDSFYLHDPLALAIALEPGLASTEPMHVDIETTGEITRGMVVGDRRPWMRAASGTHTNVCVDVKRDRFLRIFRERVLADRPA